MEMSELRDAVVKALMSTYDMNVDDAEELVAKSTVEDGEIWHEDATPENVAKFLATEKDDE